MTIYLFSDKREYGDFNIAQAQNTDCYIKAYMCVSFLTLILSFTLHNVYIMVPVMLREKILMFCECAGSTH